MLENGQSYFKNVAVLHSKILKVCLTIFQHYASYKTHDGNILASSTRKVYFPIRLSMMHQRQVKYTAN